jgi:hypothetical protein
MAPAMTQIPTWVPKYLKMRTFYEMILGKKDARIYVQRLPNNRKVFGLLNPSESSSLLLLKRFTLRTQGLNDGTDAEP